MRLLLSKRAHAAEHERRRNYGPFRPAGPSCRTRGRTPRSPTAAARSRRAWRSERPVARRTSPAVTSRPCARARRTRRATVAGRPPRSCPALGPERPRDREGPAPWPPRCPLQRRPHGRQRGHSAATTKAMRRSPSRPSEPSGDGRTLTVGMSGTGGPPAGRGESCPPPPTPVRVTKRSRSSSGPSSASSASRPTKLVSWVGRLLGMVSTARSWGKSRASWGWQSW
jgi:hypothetical protein